LFRIDREVIPQHTSRFFGGHFGHDGHVIEQSCYVI
jgi:hypothetical protein